MKLGVLGRDWSCNNCGKYLENPSPEELMMHERGMCTRIKPLIPN